MDRLSSELSGDTLQLDDPLPRKDDIRQIISDHVIGEFNRSMERYNAGKPSDDRKPLVDIDPVQLSPRG